MLFTDMCTIDIQQHSRSQRSNTFWTLSADMISNELQLKPKMR